MIGIDRTQIPTTDFWSEVPQQLKPFLDGVAWQEVGQRLKDDLASQVDFSNVEDSVPGKYCLMIDDGSVRSVIDTHAPDADGFIDQITLG